MIELASIVVHRGRDPFTPPQTKVDWIASDVPFVKVPVLRYKWMNSEVVLVVIGPDGDDVKNAADDCLRQAAIKSVISALVAGYASGGGAAITAAVTTFATTIDTCMENKLNKVLNVSVELKTNSWWDKDWS